MVKFKTNVQYTHFGLLMFPDKILLLLNEVPLYLLYNVSYPSQLKFPSMALSSLNAKSLRLILIGVFDALQAA